MANFVGATVVRAARIAVIAWVGIRRVDTSGRTTALRRASIAIITIEGDTADASAVLTGVAQGAGIAVVAKCRGGCMDAATQAITGVDGAVVSVIAVDRLTHADSGLTVVGHRTDIAI